MEFKTWSEQNPEALKTLRPDFGLRSWDKVEVKDRGSIWKHLQKGHFFHPKAEFSHYVSQDEIEYYYPFDCTEEDMWMRKKLIEKTIAKLNHKYKVKTYGKDYFSFASDFNACTDFHNIFTIQTKDVVYELLSIYALTILTETEFQDPQDEGESKEAFAARHQSYRKEMFDAFARDLNDVFVAFGVNVELTSVGLLPKQDSVITETIIKPVLASLTSPKWRVVEKLLADALFEYGKNTPQGFSHCVTETVSAFQAFLQILVKGETGKGDISELIKEGKQMGLIPSEAISTAVYKAIESILMRERQETGSAHPKKEYATEKNSRLVLNLSFVFFNHCLATAQ